MDKQTNILANTNNLIPVNTRTIGAPEGIYILYLEDYVHTFIKKILSDNSPQRLPVRGKLQRELLEELQEDLQIEGTQQHNIALYGRTLEENGRYRVVISGAAASDGSSEKIQQLNNTYFPSCTYIGNADVSLNKDSRLRIELTLRSTKVILDDFYIYYDQNEEMQNYLVEWNTTRENDKSKVVLSPANQETFTRSSTSDAARLSRITQAYNREEAKVSFMWNVMNVLCLGFVVCVMAYGIISINNYNKMQNMQASIDYCMAFVEENTSFRMTTPQTDRDSSRTALEIQQNMQAENEIAKLYEAETAQNTVAEQPKEDTASETEQPPQEQQPEQNQAQPAETPEAAQALAQAAETPETAQALAQAAEAPETAVPQYYVVQRGDTLRTICFDIYGDYSRVDEVCRWNNIDDPDNILYGQKLLLPAK